MANSMTAYGRSSGTAGGRKITVELRGVNSRFFDPNTRIPRIYLPVEDRIKARVQQAVSRGKVDIFITADVLEKSDVTVSLDAAYAASYIAALRELRDRFGLPDDISVMKVAENRDLFTSLTGEESADDLWKDVCPILDGAVAAFCEMRASEGRRLQTDLEAKRDAMIPLVDEIGRMSEANVADYHAKFEARIRRILAESGVEPDEQRILTECAVYADKVAVDEELVRLRSHFRTFDEIFASGEPVGRKLDFLVQEMNRETNTIGSKCTDAGIAKIVIDLKSRIEQIREQVQNLE